jgi:hypothetical protein
MTVTICSTLYSEVLADHRRPLVIAPRGQPWILWKLLKINRNKGPMYTLTRQNWHCIDNPASAARARVDCVCREQ